jgi:type IV secretory pathway TrbD component
MKNSFARQRKTRKPLTKGAVRPVSLLGGLLRCGAFSLVLSSAAYAAFVVVNWSRYGRTERPSAGSDDELLDRFMPVYEVRARHQTRVSAPSETTLAAARELPLFQIPLVRGIIKAREWILGAASDERPLPPGLLNQAQALGWGLLAEIPGCEIVAGAVTQPWKANVVFRALAPGEFAAFDEPGYVKIVWTLRADPLGDAQSLFSTETRAVATDPDARARFRLYWSFFSPGMALIRCLALGPLKKEAERRFRRIHPPA